MKEPRDPGPPGENPTARKKPNGFVQLTRGQIAIPHAGRGQVADISRLTPLEWKVMAALALDMWKFGGRSRMTNMEIGLAIGMDGDGNQIARKIMRVIAGRACRGGRLPGLKDKGFIKVILNTNPRNSWQREIEYTAKWLEANRIKVIETEAPESVPTATAAITAESVAQSDLPTAEQRENVFGRLPRVFTRPELAERFVKQLRDRSVVLDLVQGEIKVRRLAQDIAPLSAAEVAVLKWLREEVIAVLSPPPAPDPAVADTPRAAPRVPNAAEIRSLIGRLSSSGPEGDTCREAFADGLVAAFQDVDQERSHQTYLGIAQGVHLGELAENVVIEAFEEACKPRKQNRGAAFIHEVKRLKAISLKANEAKG